MTAYQNAVDRMAPHRANVATAEAAYRVALAEFDAGGPWQRFTDAEDALIRARRAHDAAWRRTGF